MENDMVDFDVLQNLAQTVLNICPDGYGQARLEAELDDDWAQLDLRCINSKGEVFNSDLPGITRGDLHDQLDVVRDEMAKAGGKKWTKCVFVIGPDRKFKIDVEY